MFRFACATALVLAFSISARGADVLLNTTGAKPGRYVLTIAADGTVSVGPFSQVIDLSVNPPTPTPDPNPVLTERAKAIQAAALKVTGDADRLNTAKGMAELYRQIAKLVRSGQVADLPNLVKAVKVGTDTLLNSQSAVAPWQPVRDLFSTQWTTLTAKAATLSEYAVLLDEAASGLDASAVTDGRRVGIDTQLLALIMQIVQLILSLIKH